MKFFRFSWPRVTLRWLFALLTLSCVLLAAVAYYGRTVAVAKWLQSEGLELESWWYDEYDGRDYGPHEVYLIAETPRRHWRALKHVRSLQSAYIINVHVTGEEIRNLPDCIAHLTISNSTISE